MSALWSLYFVQAQGHNTKNARIYQDNKSVILLERNDRMPSSRCTRHIKSKYFFVTDIVEDGEVAKEYWQLTKCGRIAISPEARDVVQA